MIECKTVDSSIWVFTYFVTTTVRDLFLKLSWNMYCIEKYKHFMPFIYNRFSSLREHLRISCLDTHHDMKCCIKKYELLIHIMRYMQKYSTFSAAILHGCWHSAICKKATVRFDVEQDIQRIPVHTSILVFYRTYFDVAV